MYLEDRKKLQLVILSIGSTYLFSDTKKNIRIASSSKMYFVCAKFESLDRESMAWLVARSGLQCLR